MTMKRPARAALTAVFTALALSGAGVAQAHEGAGGNLGLGVGLGAPTAISMEVAPTPHSGFELALGLRTFSDNDVYAHLTYKHNLVRLAHGPTVVVPLYLGLGGFMRDQTPGGVTDFGARVPMGVNFDFTRTPLQVFGEIALEAVLVSDAPVDRSLGLGGYAGARVWF